MYSLEFIMIWLKAMTKLRIIVFVMNVLLIGFGLFVLIDSRFLVSKYYNEDAAMVAAFLLIVGILNFIFVIKTRTTESDNQSLLSLWIKRKRLETEARIKELEK